jgi:formamidopyrimidine-DNA glycosylase
MPELPEVETVRTGLASEIVGRRITAIVPGDFPGVMGEIGIDQSIARVVDREICDIARRGKYLILLFQDGDGIVIHLRMTGVLTLEARTTPLPRFHRLTLSLDGPVDLRFADQRKFGRVIAATSDDIAALDSRLGPEPLSSDFTVESLQLSLRNRSAPVKAVLLDQTVVAGLGNIYVDEALFRASIHPRMAAGLIGDDDLVVLHGAVRAVLEDGIRHRGTSFSSYRNANGNAGDNQHHLAVYGRAARSEPCLRCGNPLARIVVGGRGTHYCPNCQQETGIIRATGLS